jgi:hypothetical protein
MRVIGMDGWMLVVKLHTVVISYLTVIVHVKQPNWKYRTRTDKHEFGMITLIEDISDIEGRKEV